MSLAVLPAVAAGLGTARAGASPATRDHGDRVLLVGTWHGRHGQFSSIQDAVNAAKPGDWILVGPGDYRESPSRADGVLVTTPKIHIRGMDRNHVLVDGTAAGAHGACDPSPSAQNLGPGGSGRNGIEVLKANGVTIENLTACNFLSGSSGGGNEIWFNGGDKSGLQNLGAFHGAYLTATSTFASLTNANLAQYGLFVSNSFGPGEIVHSYGSNMADAAFYVGACPDCNVVLNHDIGENSVLGYSGTNAGGHLQIENSRFDRNRSGIVPNSLNNDDAPPPQDGACPGGGIGPTGTHSCTIIHDNLVDHNNNPNVNGGGNSGGTPSVIGAGIVLAGDRNDTVLHNVVTDNGSWGILATDFPDLETPPPVSHCQGGVSLATNLCVFQAFGNEIRGNVLDGNGFFRNPTNGDLAEATIPHDPGNCWLQNHRPPGDHAVTSDPADIQSTQGICGAPDGGDLAGPLGVELACNTQTLGPCTGSNEAAVVAQITVLVSLLGAPTGGLNQPGIDALPANYPVQTKALAPFPHPQQTMDDPCAGVPHNAWCR